jgi:hypothetical protein
MHAAGEGAQAIFHSTMAQQDGRDTILLCCRRRQNDVVRPMQAAGMVVVPLQKARPSVQG